MHASFSRHHRPALVGTASVLLAIVGCSSSPDGPTAGSGGNTEAGGRAAVSSGGRAIGSSGLSSSGGAGSGGATTGGRGGWQGTGGRTTGSGGLTGSGGVTGHGGRSANGGNAGALASGGSGGRPSLTGGTGAGGRVPADAATDGMLPDLALDGTRDLAQRDTSLEGAVRRDATDGTGSSYDGDPAEVADDGGISVPEGYRLVWADEFDVEGTPAPTNWNYEKGFARNEELQWYQPDNASVQDGMLVIEARAERVANPNYRAGSSDWKTSRPYAEYTSTSMTTSGLQTWQYGRFEMRARIPTGAGMWPAWWTLGTSGEWPSNGEVDIMEFYKGNVLANVACGTSTRWTAKWDSSTKSLSSLGGATWAAQFHVWRMDWDDQRIELYLDDVLLNSVSLASMLNPDGTSPFKQKHYMLVNLAVGGVNGGDPSSTPFPVRYEVDWIRVFQKL